MPADPTNLEALYAFLVAFLLALVLVPLTRRLALRVGAIDYPNERKLHTVPTPKLEKAPSMARWRGMSFSS